jgi:hypothetical protein
MTRPSIASLAASGLFALGAASAAGAIIYSNDFEATGFTNSYGAGIVSHSLDPTGGVGGSGAGVLDNDSSSVPPGDYWHTAAQIWLGGGGTAVGNAGVTDASQVTLTFDVYGSSDLGLRVMVESGNGPLSGSWNFNFIDIIQPATYQSVSLTFSDATSIGGTPSLTAGNYNLNFMIGGQPNFGDWPEGIHQLRIDNVVLATSVPEPAAFAKLAGVFVLGCAAFRRRPGRGYRGVRT